MEYLIHLEMKKETYFIKNINMDKEIVNELFENLNEYDTYLFFNIFLINKDYCHLVLNNEYILTKMQNIFNKYLPLYKYLFSYAWLSFYIDESLLKTKITKEDRFVFDINTASKLPIFPLCSEDLLQNPYIALAVNSKLINKNNLFSLYHIEGFEYGISNFYEFKRKLNIFITGDEKMDIFEELDWTNFAISGSVIPACSQLKSPLYKLTFSNELTETENMSKFFNTYYKNSDIDILSNSKTLKGFMNDTDHIMNIIKKKLNDDSIKFTSNKTVMISVHKILFDKFFNEIVEGIEQVNAEMYEDHEDFIIATNKIDLMKNINHKNHKAYFYKLYIKNKKILDGNTDLINDFNQIVDINDVNIMLIDYNVTMKNLKVKDFESYIYLNSFDKNVDENIMVIKISESIKYSIKGDKLLHNIELFRSKNNDFFSTIARFHLPCVRGYYTGNNVYLLPSCITAMITGLNLEYKYFSGKRDPIDILNKYRKRGFGTILNKSELKQVVDYNKKNNENHIMLPKKMSDIDESYEDLNNYIITLEDLISVYKRKYNYDHNESVVDVFKLKCINNNGNVLPLKTWIIDEFYDVINK